MCFHDDSLEVDVADYVELEQILSFLCSCNLMEQHCGL